MKTNKKTITLTYKMYPETKGYSVKCLNWDSIYTQGDTIKECKKHAIEATTLMLPDLKKETLHKLDYPKIKARKKSPHIFALTFDLQNNKRINIEKEISISVKNKELDALEDLLFVELSPTERKKVIEQTKKLWQKLITAFDKQQIF